MARDSPVTSAVPCSGPVTLVSRNSPPSESSVRTYVVEGADGAGPGGLGPPESAGRRAGRVAADGRAASTASSGPDSRHSFLTVFL